MALRPGPQDLSHVSNEAASDESLAAQASTLADSAAFETLMRRHERRILHLHVRFSRSASVAEELCQETFLRAWRKLGTFHGQGSFAGWLTKLAYNVFLQHLRRNRRHAQVEFLEQLPESVTDAALSVPDSAGQGPELDRLLAVLSTEERELLVLNYAGGLSTTEIGDMLGVSSGTVKSQIHRAKQKIRRHFHIETES